MSSKLSTTYIKAIARHHGLFITLTGVFALCVMTWLSNYFWQQARLPLLFLVLVALVTLFIGLLKLAEPKHSLILTPTTLVFQHRHGHWQINWQQIRNIHSVNNTVGIVRHELNYVGIKVHSLDAIANNTSLRLANRMIHEQQPLIHYCIKQQLITFEQGIINFAPFKLTDGRLIKGPMAAFLHHCELLHSALGAHLFISASNLNGTINDFVALANDYLIAAKDSND